MKMMLLRVPLGEEVEIPAGWALFNKMWDKSGEDGCVLLVRVEKKKEEVGAPWDDWVNEGEKKS